MTRPNILQLPYYADSAHWALQLQHEPGFVWLDSAGSERGRYDVLACRPLHAIQIDQLNIVNNQSIEALFVEPARAIIEQFEATELSDEAGWPLCSGWIGFWSYDLGLGQHGIEASGDSPFPAAWAGFYDWVLCVDHKQQRCALLGHPAGDLEGLRKRHQTLLSDTTSTLQPARFGAWRQSTTKTDYRRQFQHVQNYIAAGDCYQVNLARHFQSDCDGDALDAYLRLRRIARAPHSGFVDTGKGQLLSLSPERFLSCRQRQLETAPIKGTAARWADAQADRQSAESLAASSKNRAENLMIVDLLRNDLGQVCETGSVQVDKLFELQTFETVHHLVSLISGRLRKDLCALEMLQHCFPGGSITGAPKRRAMEIIQELEPVDRGPYCGSLFYWSTEDALDSNIAIRSLWQSEGRIHAWAGGGLVADSDCDEEFTETLSKIKRLLSELNSDGIEGPD